jgi:acyl-homoserine lactone acylase PvdQ
MRSFVAALAAISVLVAPAAASAAGPTPQPYQFHDGLGFHDVLPAGANGFVSGPGLAQWELDRSARPSHSDDQLSMYSDLIYGAPGLTKSKIGNYYKDSSFGVKTGEAERTYSPCPNVTIVRDSSFGVPHVYGSTHAGTMCGIGYATAEDRLFFIDVLRHAGRAELSSFAGGAAGNRAMDESVWADTPYNEEDLQRQFDLADEVYGARGAALQADVQAYIQGINTYVSEARLDPSKMPGEYTAIGRPQGPDNFIPTDLIAEAALVGGIFGKGGGRELDSALFLQSLKSRFGSEKGLAAWEDFRNADNFNAPMTVRDDYFPYEQYDESSGRHVGRAMPDRGSVVRSHVIESSTGTGNPASTSSRSSSPGNGLLGSFVPRGTSNALLISARESRLGHPVAVMGPQVAYFNPEILMEEDVHGPGIDARGAAFPGVNLYVELGRGRDYSWSATSAGQDVVDTFAAPLCNADGSTPTIDSDHYKFRGQCLPFETLTKTISWTPNAGDPTGPGSETLRALRTKVGIVIARAMVHGKPVAYTKLRTTYFHEADSALGFRDLNDPGKVHDVRSFQRAANKIGFTFNWFYADNRHIGYYNSGWNPVRAKGTDPNFPVFDNHMWRGYDPSLLLEDRTPFREHPQTIDQSWITSWNNKQAFGYSAADDNFNYGSTYRVVALNTRIKHLLRGRHKASLAGLISAMEDAGSVDLRGATVLPYALQIIGPPRKLSGPLKDAVRTLRAWAAAGAHRRDLNKDGTYDQSAAVRLMDAWWPHLLQAEFGDVIGTDAYAKLNGLVSDDPPHGVGGEQHGSAYNGGLYVHANEDLRDVLLREEAIKEYRQTRPCNGSGRRCIAVRRLPLSVIRRFPPLGFSRFYCGHGKLRKCRSALLGSLNASLSDDPYPGGAACNVGDIQACWDAIKFRAVGGITQPLIPWINRPTYQQAVEIRHHR